MKSRIIALFALIFLIIPLMGMAEDANFNIKKSPLDDREYASIILPNGLKVIVVSDKDSPMAGAALIVKAGLYDDPKAYPGLAHFLEHMLFLGTQKFPVPDEFQNFIQAYGGDRNAMTSGDRTSYFFSIQPEAFEPALVRFADFFVSPAFYPEYVDRELNAVDQEFYLYLHQDNWAGFEISKETANPLHPYHDYFGGNMKTLGHDKKNLPSALKTFFKTHYHAGNMTLALVGPQSIQELVAYTKQFSSIAKMPEDYKRKEYPELYSSQERGLDIYMKTKGQVQELAISFVLPYENDLSKRKSNMLIASILGHEGKKGLAYTLKKSKWIAGMSVSYEASSDEQDGLHLSFTLTNDGLNHVDEITRQVFQAINLLKKKGIPDYYIDEIKAINQANFLYIDKQEASNLATALAAGLQKLPAESLITSGFLLQDDEVSFKSIEETLSKLIPQNMRRVVASPTVSGNIKSKWYQAEYRVEKLSKSELRRLNKPYYFSHLALPEKNEFIPEHLTLEKQPQAAQHEPQIIREGKLTLWHYQDHAFNKPRSAICINFNVPWISDSPKNILLAKAYAHLMIDYLREDFYAAGLAGAHISLQEHTRGISLKVAGYSDKQRELLMSVLHSMKKFQAKSSAFESIKDTFDKSFRNYDQKTLLEKAQVELSTLIFSTYWHPDELVKTLQSLTVQDLKMFQSEFWKDLHLDMLVYGNVTESQALKLSDCVNNIVLPTALRKNENVGVKIANLSTGSKQYHQISPAQGNHAVVWYTQNTKKDDVTLAKTLMLSQLIEVPYYQALRVDKQLAYTLAAQALNFKKTSGFVYTIQSTKADPNQLITEMQRFFSDFRKNLHSFDKEEYKLTRESLIQKLTQPPQTMEEQFGEWWGVIEMGENDFHENEKIASALAAVELGDLIEFANLALSPQSSQAELLILSSPLPSAKKASKIASTQTFKEEISYAG